MNLADRRRIGTARLAALGLSRPLADPTPMGVVQAHAAMQAQDLGSGLWSIGIRTGGVVDDVLAAVERREITRTWPMRGTLHWVPAADVGWMCQLLSGPAQRGADRVLAAEGLTEAIVGRAEQRWAEHLDSAGTMSRAEATEVLARAGIDGGGQRTYHLLVRHCQTGLLCQGPIRASATWALVPTFVLHDEWVRSPNRPGREQALAQLAERYVASHGPVTERDFAGWCDQPLRVAREAVALTDGRVHSVRLGDAAYLVHADAGDPGELGTHRGALLVPGFDEWLLGYKDRAAQLTPEQAARVVPGGNGMFRGTLVAGGLVVGTWRRTLTRAGVTVEVTPFGPVGVTARRAAGRAVAAYGRFLGVAATLRWADG